MIKLGNTARHLRDVLGLKQREVAEALNISIVHLCNIENNKSSPSPALVAKYREVWGVDLYILAWCLSGDMKKLPPAVRQAAVKLSDVWQQEVRARLNRRKEE